MSSPEERQAEYRVTAIPMPAGENWQHSIADAVSELGLVHEARRSAVRCWHAQQIKQAASFSWVDGFEIKRVTLGSKDGLLGILPIRLYFSGDQLDSRKELDILGSHKRPDSNQRAWIADFEQLAHHLCRILNLEEIVPAEVVRATAHEDTKIIGRGSKVLNTSEHFSKSILSHGFRNIPPDFRIVIVYMDAYHSAARAYGAHLSHWLNDLSKDASPKKWVRECAASAALEELTKREQLEGNLRDNTVFLLAVTGTPGTKLHPEMQQVVDTLERLNWPFRAFSVDGKEQKWAAADQLFTLVEAGGGSSYTLRLPSDGEPLLYFVGVDLGHSAKRRVSRPSVSLVGSDGRLIYACCSHQPLDENMSTGVLIKLLGKIADKAKEHAGGGPPRFLVFRDGRRQQPESHAAYENALKGPVSICDIGKYDTPIVYDPSSCQPVGFGTISRVLGTTSFITNMSHAMNNGFANPVRLSLSRLDDTLKIGQLKAAEIAIGLCFAPSLGRKVHKTAPIYWADGFGSTSPDSLRFKGFPELSFINQNEFAPSPF